MSRITDTFNRTDDEKLILFRKSVIDDPLSVAKKIGKALTAREEEVIELRSKGISLGAVAEELGITPCRVRQIEHKTYMKYRRACG